MQRSSWKVNGQVSQSKKLPYVSLWKSFTKLSEDEKEKTFNAMRAELIAMGRMENK